MLTMRNTFGHLYTLTTFGESHGAGIGGVVDGMPAGIAVDMDFIQSELNRRRPGQSNITTGRQEGDVVELLSGIFEGKTTGCPIGFLVRNTNQHSNDYANVCDVFRPSHADFTYTQKYGFRDYRGGGRSSARETISRCVGGALAKLTLKQLGIKVIAYTSQVGDIAIERDYRKYDFSQIEQNAVRCPDAEVAKQMEQLILDVKAEGDTIGGIITCVIQGCSIGLGEPVFSKLHADLGASMLGINAVHGFEYGEGFSGVGQRGSEQHDLLGGIQGGISNGQDIYFRVLFKPVATQLRPQQTVNQEGKEVTLEVKGRHDPCVLPRAVPVVEVMAAMTILDHYLLNKTVSLK